MVLGAGMSTRIDEADQAIMSLGSAIDQCCKVGRDPIGMDLLSARFSNLAETKWLLDVLISRLRPITRDPGLA